MGCSCESPTECDLPRPLPASACHRPVQCHGERLGEGIGFCGTPSMGKLRLDRETRQHSAERHLDLDEVHHAGFQYRQSPACLAEYRRCLQFGGGHDVSRRGFPRHIGWGEPRFELWIRARDHRLEHYLAADFQHPAKPLSRSPVRDFTLLRHPRRGCLVVVWSRFRGTGSTRSAGCRLRRIANRKRRFMNQK